MTTEPQVTHPGDSPPATHPPTIALGVISDGVATAPDKTSTVRRARRTRRLPPPRVLAAVVLTVAALELLLWQVGGPLWGIVVHAAIAAGVLAAIIVALAWRRRRTTRRPGTARTSGQAPTGGSPRTKRSPLGRLFNGRTPGRPPSGGSPRTKRSPLGRLLGPRGRKPDDASPNGGPRRRGTLDKLFGSKRRPASPRRGPASKTSGRRRSDGPFRNPFKNRSTTGGRPGSAPTAKNNRSSGTAPHKYRSRLLADFLRGFREGTQAKPATRPERTRTPSPEPNTSSPPKQPAPVDKPADQAERLVREAVTQASDATAASETPPNTGGLSVGDMNKVRAAADELAAALKEYDPDTMHQLVREMPHLGEALAAVSAGFKHLASRAESEWPVAAKVVDGLRSIATDIKAGAGTAEAARTELHKQNETDIERAEAPRHGSREIESKWDVGRAE